MYRRRPSWDPFDPNALNHVDHNSSLGRDLLLIQNYLALERGEAPVANRLTGQQIKDAIESLPYLTEADLERLGHHDSTCSICMNTLLASIAEEELARAMDSPAHPVELLGVTRLAKTCGHTFCRKELRTTRCPCHIVRRSSSMPSPA
ncbi:hypothetical protein BC834DRAFT_868516 [Gloeopeniophorella convolvens]|nr:hypothetical protein BC834DRAFT_868516 [Gloeopeniophorella convolvens]